MSASRDLRLDLDRRRRTGDPEVVFGEGKTPGQIAQALLGLNQANPDRAVLATRLSAEAQSELAGIPNVQLDPVGRTATLGPLPEPAGTVTILTAGTCDVPVAAEAATTVRAFGATATTINDVGVAGLHRLLSVSDQFEDADCLIVVAGMEGALPSVVGGLTGVPVLAVPSSVGYGASLGGLAALLAMLNSCAPGVGVLNIDNGFGAGVLAARIARRSAPRQR